MKRLRPHPILLAACLTIYLACVAQERPLGLEVNNWGKVFSNNKRTEVNSSGRLLELLLETDSLRALSFLDSLESSNYARGYYFRMFFCMLKAEYLYKTFADYNKIRDRTSKELLPVKDQLIKLYDEALDAAYHVEDDMLTGWVNFYSARRMKHFGETSWAVMYSKNGVDFLEKAKWSVEPPVYTDLAEVLYQVREYDECITYAKKGLHAWTTNNYENVYKPPQQLNPYTFKIRALNTIGNSFYSKGQYDSAGHYFHLALTLAQTNRDTVLMGKCLGNVGRIKFSENQLDTAYGLFKTSYLINKGSGLYDDAAHATTWAANISLLRGNRATALTEAREAIHLLQLWPNGSYLRDAYLSMTRIFREMKNWDSAFHYNDVYASINDSLEKVVATNSLAISKARLNDEMGRYRIQKLNREKQRIEQGRNVVVVFIVFTAVISLLIINRKRLKEKLRKEKAENEKWKLHQDVAFAKEQMRLITANIIEKTDLIEKLNRQIKDHQATTDQKAIIAELTQQTILTEDDWIRFKELFEKIHPFFFATLSQTFTGVTPAEQRMAALIRLGLTTRQAAAMLGISVDSVHKSRQRLRQRLCLHTDSPLEKTLANLQSGTHQSL